MLRSEIEASLALVRAARERSECRTSLRHFVQAAYPHLSTGTDLTWNWHLDAICDFLQAQAAGEIRRGVINLRSRSLKSTIASVCLHPWVWLERSGVRFLTGGYDSGLAVRDCWNARQLMTTDWYVDLKSVPWEFTDDMNLKAFYTNTHGGRRISTQVGAGTGQGAMHVVVDDPLSIDQSYSEAETEAANRWFFETIMSRLDDPKRAVVTLVQHRLRPDDTSGRCRERGFTVLELPLEFDPKRRCVVPEIGFTDPREDDGELLCPAWWGPEEVEQEKMNAPALYEAICNQNPTRREANVIREEWCPRYDSLPPLDEMHVVQSWDLSVKGQDPSAKGKRKRSKTGGLVVGFHGARCYVLDRFFAPADWFQQKDAIRLYRDRWPTTRETYIEDEANGSAMILEIGLTIPMVIGVNPGKKGGKWQRLAAVAGFFRAGNVLFPPDMVSPWASDLIANLVGFPNMTNDEDPDCISQALSEVWLPKADAPESPKDRAAKILSIDWSS